MARTIFLSYARDDSPLVEHLHEDLTDAGHSPYYDRTLDGGHSWWDQLLHRIEDASLFVPVLSRAYLESAPCAREADYALTLSKTFLPVQVGQPVSNALFIPTIAEAQWMAYEPDQTKAILGLLRAIEGSEPSPPLPDPMPPRPAAPVSYLTELRAAIESTTDLPRSTQLELVVQLRARYRGKEARDVQDLLERFRARPDLYETVANDIDALLRAGPSGQPVGPPVGVQPPLSEPPPPGGPLGVPPQPPSVSHPQGATPTNPAPSWQNPGPSILPNPPHPNPTLPRSHPPQQGPSPYPTGAPAGTAAMPLGIQNRPMRQPSSHLGFTVTVLVLNIIGLVTVFGVVALPFGILGVHNARLVGKRFDTGDLAGSRSASHRALAWSWMALLLTIGAAALLYLASRSSSS